MREMPVYRSMKICSRRDAETQSEYLGLGFLSAAPRLCASYSWSGTARSKDGRSWILSASIVTSTGIRCVLTRVSPLARRSLLAALFIALIATAIVRGENPTTQPAQSDLDFLLSKSSGLATQPTTTPTTEPSSPIQSGATADSRQGMIVLSSGDKLHGEIAHTQRKPIRIWVEADKEYKDVQFASIRAIDVRVVWERLEKEWNFKESGSDVKVYSGKTYPAREMQYQITLDNGKTITGGVSEPLYLLAPDGSVTYVLHKRDKGELGQSLDELVYVKHVEFGDEPPTTQPRKD
jgi:hypothetical protein